MSVPPFLLKVLVTTLIGGSAYLLTNITDQPEIWKLTISVFLGGAVLVIQYMIDFEARLGAVEGSLTAHNGEMKDLVAGGFARINEVTELFGLVDRSALPPETITRLLRGAARIDSAAPRMMQDFVREQMSSLAILMENLNQRFVDYEGEEHDWLLALTQCVSGTIDATSSSVDDGFWASEPGRRYLRAQREAIAYRSIRVRRLFIVDTPDQRSGVQQLIDDQRSLGIEVRLLVLSEPLPVSRMDETHDFIVFDEELSYELSSDLRRLYTATYMDWRPDRVSRRVQRFRALWDAAAE